MPKVDRSKMRRPLGPVPADCKNLIQKFISAKNDAELLHELETVGTHTWTVAKCELYHWVDVLDLFDSVLGRAISKQVDDSANSVSQANPTNSTNSTDLVDSSSFDATITSEPKTTQIDDTPNSTSINNTSTLNSIKCNFTMNLDIDPLLKSLTIAVLNFTALLVEYSCSRHIYPSIEHVLDLLLATNYSAFKHFGQIQKFGQF